MEPRVISIANYLPPTGNALIYTPKNFNINGTIAKGQGFINTLRANCYIESLPEIVLPPLDPAADAYQIDQRNQELASKPSKTVAAYLVRPDNNWINLFQFKIFSTRPRYFADLSLFLTDLEIYGIQNNFSLYMGMVDEGFGTLSGNDFIAIQGSALETCSILVSESASTGNSTVIDLLSIPA